MMRIVFCGTPSFAVPTLKHLLAQSDFKIVGVITQPDRPRGRGQEVSFSAVKQAALAAKVAVHQPEKIRAAESEALLQNLAPDCVVIIAYGQIIPARLLPIPKLGWINLHASLLPKYRGAAPIKWAVVNGETRTGRTTMRIEARTRRLVGRAATSGAIRCLKKEAHSCRAAQTRRTPELCFSRRTNFLFGAVTQPFCAFGPSNWRDASKFQPLNLQMALG